MEFYIIKTNNHPYYKFGISSDLQKRVYKLNFSCPHKLEVLYSLEIGHPDFANAYEKQIHRLFANYLIPGKVEWFEIRGTLDLKIFEKFNKEFQKKGLKHLIRRRKLKRGTTHQTFRRFMAEEDEKYQKMLTTIFSVIPLE